MGLSVQYVCKQCGHAYVQDIGFPMFGNKMPFHCEGCGKMEWSEEWLAGKPCDCGGTFTEQPVKLCPQCGCTETTDDGECVELWD